jgi:class 3 adenylate cyclase
MSLIEEIEEDVRDATLARDAARGTRRADPREPPLRRRIPAAALHDEELQVLQRERKRRIEAAEAFRAPAATSRREKDAELAVLEEFMPAPSPRRSSNASSTTRRRERRHEHGRHGPRHGRRDAADAGRATRGRPACPGKAARSDDLPGVRGREPRFCDSRSRARRRAPREQRKTVTVLFCDVAGSTALAERVDPEALRAVMASYFDVARAAIERHGGTLEKFIGDAVMAVFGVPTVREDDALRAVRAAQELRDAVEIDVRIGVNTGQVVTGTADALVTGEAVNVAARLEQSAEPGDVLLGESTYRLVREAVDVELLPPLSVKGKSEPLTAYRLRAVTGENAFARRQDAPFVGRDRERRPCGRLGARLLEGACALFTPARRRRSRQSRLSAEFLDSVDATVVAGRCLPYGDGITYWPVVSVVKQLLADTPAPNAAIAALLGDGQASADEIAVAVRRLFESKAAERPLVVVFDDLQWAEPTFLDLIEHIADWSRGASIL